jgi:hypothetical protein
MNKESTMYQMIKPAALREWQRQISQGLQPKMPEGAFDVMHPRLKRALARDQKLGIGAEKPSAEKISSEKPTLADQLPSSVRRQLDVLSPQARDSLRRYLGKDQGPLIPLEIAGAKPWVPARQRLQASLV